MFGRGKEQRRVERERRAVLAAVAYLEAGIRHDEKAVDAAVNRVDGMELQAAVIQLAQRAIVILGEMKATTPAAAAAELAQGLIGVTDPDD